MEIAEGLLIKYITGQATGEETGLVRKWTAKSEDNRQDLEQLKNCWILSGLDREINEVEKNREIQKILQRIKQEKQQHIRAYRIRIIQYAAALLVLISFSFLLKFFLPSRLPSGTQGQLSEIIVSKGERSRLILPDGSSVRLNGDSRLKFPASFNRENRIVYLEGEAFFDVEHKDGIPFTVKISNISIEVMGTKFNVSGYKEDPCILAYLETGKIKITDSGQKGKRWILSPREAFMIDKESGNFSLTRISDSRYLDWTKGILTVKGETIRNLAKKLERRFNVTIRFKDKKVGDHIYSGSIKDEELATVLEALKFTSSLNYTINEDTVTIQSK